MITTVLSQKGQVVIPADVRARLGLTKVDRFEVETQGDRVVLKRLPRHPFLELRGIVKGEDSLTEELLRERARAIVRKRMPGSFVLDSFALLALLMDEPAADQVDELLADPTNESFISVINLGEVLSMAHRR
ncbi:MAG TPA: AbrB/MazE/SpoVT family DNA-binding domain-containing protein [Chloroflexota bacterium]